MELFIDKIKLNNDIKKYIDIINENLTLLHTTGSITSVNFTIDIEGITRYLVDYDFMKKEYFKCINKYLDDTKLFDKILKDENKNWHKEGYLYFRYTYYRHGEERGIEYKEIISDNHKDKKYKEALQEQQKVLHFVSEDSEKVKREIGKSDKNEDWKKNEVWKEILEGIESKLITNEKVSVYNNLLFFYKRITLNNKSRGLLTIHIKLNSEISEDDIKALSKVLNPLFEAISISLLAPLYIELHKSACIKTAKTAIMSRNMSHNLGSHVMFYLKEKLQTVQSVVDKDVLLNMVGKMVKCSLDESKKCIEWKRNYEEIELPFLIGLGRFLNYLQERQDFIATVSTDYSPYFSSVNFKEFIYDELNYDKKIIRHKGTSFFKNKESDNILLDYIAKSEGFERKNIVIRFGEFDGLNNVARDSNGDITGECDNEAAKESYKLMRGINIDLPAGIMGRQAFFSIIENFIRNSAKHYRRNTNLLEVKINIEDNRDPNLYKVTLTNNLGDYEQAETTLEKAIEDSYIDDQGRMHDRYKGIKEMRISAAWLRGITDESQHNDILKVEGSEKDGKEGSVQYTFYLKKSKPYAFVYENTASQSSDIPVISKETFIKEYRDSYYRFIVAESSLKNDSEFVKLCHARVLYIDTIDTNKSMEEYVEQYMTERFGKKLLNSLVIDDKKDKTRSNYDSVFSDSKITVLDAPLKGIASPKATVLPKEFFIIQNGNQLPPKSIVFKNHFEDASEYNTTIRNLPTNEKAVSYIEAITGSNSTHRIIRNEQHYNKAWAYSLLESALTTIFIFDERLSGIEFSSKKESKLKRLKKAYNTDTPLTAVRKVLNKLYFNNAEFKTIITHLKKGNDNELLKYIDSQSPISLSLDHINRLLKNLVLFNINKKGEIYAASDIPVLIAELKIRRKGKKIISVSVIKRTDELKVIIDKNEIKSISMQNSCNFITIHQGILDKIYGYYNIEGDDDRKKVTQAFKDYFIKSKESSFDNNRNKIIIHSGRSKPNIESMPQEDIPFITYSAFEQAYKDCKYTLTDLVYSARCEKENYE